MSNVINLTTERLKRKPLRLVGCFNGDLNAPLPTSNYLREKREDMIRSAHALLAFVASQTTPL